MLERISLMEGEKIMQAEPLEVFISYAQADIELKNKLCIHLSNLTRQGSIKPWYDGAIVPGTEWERQILEHLDTAHLILLLISADFMASDFCFSTEMEQAMARHNAKQARVIPVLLRPTDWSGAPFSILQTLPTGAKTVIDYQTQDHAFTEVVKGIRQAIDDLAPNGVSKHGAISVPSQVSRQVLYWHVQLKRNPYFTGQEGILEQLHATLNTDKAVALTQPQAINGLGGIGKTQIVLEYAYRHEQAYQAVLWVQADTRDELISGFSKLAILLDLREKDAQDQGMLIEAVKRWLETHEQWLLILDNADELALLDKFLPRKNKGHILLTTRAQAQGTLANGIEVEPMEVEEGALLLLRRAKVLPPGKPLEMVSNADQTIAREIVQQLGGLPLALDQAAAYIEETGCGLAQYLQRYRAERKPLLEWRGKLTKYPNSVATTWSLSFSSLEANNSFAADLLRLCAFLHSNAIPEELLSKGAPELIPSLQQLANKATAFDKAIAALRNYSLIRRQPETTTLSMHRLVQTVIKDEMSNSQREQWAKNAVRCVNKLLPTVEFANWPLCERYLLHAQTCAALIDEWSLTILEAASLLNQVGSYLHDRGRYQEAEPLLKRALAISERELGITHLDTAISLNNLAGLYQNQGKYREAESLLKRALAIREQQLGKDHPDTATALNNLAGLYQVQGEYKEAEPLLRRALAIREQQLGKYHPDTATTLNNLAYFYQDQGEYKEAEPLLRRALAIRAQQLGKYHPDTATSLNNLAYLYIVQRKYGEAEPLLKGALAIRTQQLGDTHPDTATTLNNLAYLYQVQGKYKEAEHLYQRTLAIREQRLGATHPDLATTLNNLAYLYLKQENYEEAEPLYRRALTIREQQLGKDHPSVVITLSNAALLYQAQGKYEEAEPLLKRALAICEQRLGKDHSDTATTLNYLADLYQRQEKYEEAEPLLKRALAICEQRLGKDHDTTVAARDNHAILLQGIQERNNGKP